MIKILKKLNYTLSLNLKLIIKNFSTSPVGNNHPGKPVIELDNSSTKDNVLKNEGIYRIYNNLYFNDNFIENLAQIMEDLHDESEFTVFRLFFFQSNKVLPCTHPLFRKGVNSLIKHLTSYPTETLVFNKCKVYKNIGLLFTIELLVFTSFCDFNNLKNISNNIKIGALNNIENINKTIHLDQGNTIPKFNDKVNPDEKLMLILHADFYRLKSLNTFKNKNLNEHKE